MHLSWRTTYTSSKIQEHVLFCMSSCLVSLRLVKSVKFNWFCQIRGIKEQTRSLVSVSKDSAPAPLSWRKLYHYINMTHFTDKWTLHKLLQHSPSKRHMCNIKEIFSCLLFIFFYNTAFLKSMGQYGTKNEFVSTVISSKYEEVSV